MKSSLRPPPRLSSSLLPRSSPSFSRRPRCTRIIHHLRCRQCRGMAYIVLEGPTPLHEFPPTLARVYQLGFVIYGVVVFPGQDL